MQRPARLGQRRQGCADRVYRHGLSRAAVVRQPLRSFQRKGNGGLSQREKAFEELKAPFAIDDPKGFNTPLSVTTHDLWHRFYQNQMQIDGGKNDLFVAYADSGALVMGYYDGSKLPLWDVAKQYTLADNFFMGSFGGSFLNHFWLICSCTPTYPNADRSPAKELDLGRRG